MSKYISISFATDYCDEEELIKVCRRAVRKLKKRNPRMVKGQVMLKINYVSPSYREVDLSYTPQSNCLKSNN